MCQPNPLRRLALSLVLVAVGASSAPAVENSDAQLHEIESALSAARDQEARLEAEAQAQADQLKALEQQGIALASRIQTTEDALTAAEGRLRDLDAEVTAMQAALGEKHVEIARLTTSLHRLIRLPAEAALIVRATPTDGVRSGIVLRAALPRLADAAASLRHELTELAQARSLLEDQRVEHAKAVAALAQDRLALTEVIRQRSELHASTRKAALDAGSQARRLALQSRDLRELVLRLAHARTEADRRARAEAAQQPLRDASASPGPQLAAAPASPFGSDSGRLIPPVRGTVVLGYGQPDQFGLPHKGLTIAARAEAQVVAPSAGQVAFAGPFRGYGQILIIEHGEGYHTLMAGFGHIHGGVGQSVAAGEPLGTTIHSDEGAATFYIELRRNGQPIDPLPWLATLMQKVPG